jgi:hypothetical protein
MAAGAVGSVWAAGSWSETCWEANSWADATITLLTEGVYMMIDLGGGLVYLKPTSPRLEVNLTTGHVGEIT